MNEMIAQRIVTIGLLSLTLFACTNSNPYYQADKAHHTAVGFINSDPSLAPKNWLDVLHWRLTESPAKSDQPISIPRVEVNVEKLRQPTAPQVTWIGHSTMLVQSDGLTFLTDPIFSERASPLSFVGPKRHQPPALSLEQLPPIDAVLISHSHYDHLDEASVKALAQQPSGSPLFLVPLGVEKLLHDWGISRLMELDWWDSHQLNHPPIDLANALKQVQLPEDAFRALAIGETLGISP